MTSLVAQPSSTATTFHRERIADVWDEAQLMLKDNAAESGAGLPFQPDKATYFGMESIDALRLYTARYEDKLVGYALFIFSKHPQYSASTVALQEVVYMAPEFRGYGAAKFLMWADVQLEAEGAEAIVRQVRIGGPDYSKTLTRMGYEPLLTSFIKRF